MNEIYPKIYASACAQSYDPGIWVVVARPGAEVLLRIERELSRENYAEICALLVLAHEKSCTRTRDRRIRASAQTMGRSVSIEVRYGPRTLARDLLTPLVNEALVMFIPYNGGQLTRSDFCLACEYNTGCEEELDALLIIAEPRLTAFEKTINEAVSAHFSGAQTTNVQELLQLRIHLLQKTSRK